MSYTKQVWNTGEKITADKLNHIERGIANACGKVITPVKRTVDIDGVATPVIQIYVAAESGGAHRLVGVLFADDFENISVFDAISTEHDVAKILTTQDYTAFKVEPDYSFPSGVYLISDTAMKVITCVTNGNIEDIVVLPSTASIEYFKGR